MKIKIQIQEPEGGRLSLLVHNASSRGIFPPVAQEPILRLDPRSRVVELRTTPPTHQAGWTAAEWLGRIVILPLPAPANAEAVVAFLREEEAQGLLARICDGFYRRQATGVLDGDATDAVGELEKLLDRNASRLILRSPDAGLMEAESWLGTDYEVPADADLDELAEELTADAAAQDIVLVGLREALKERL